MNAEIQLPRRSDRCFATERPFEVGDAIAVVLLETTEGYERRDYALDSAPEILKLEIARWRTIRRAPSQPSPHAIDRVAIFDFFKKLSEPDSPHQVQFRFVLALLLWRKKALHFELSEPRENGECWHFSVPKSEECFEVYRPELDDEDVERLSAQLESLLSEGVSDLEMVGAGAQGV